MSTNKLDQLYRSVIMDHYKNPRNKGVLEESNVTIDMNNPTCGDVIHLTLKVEDGIVQNAKFEGEGCSISMASASMMTQMIKRKDGWNGSKSRPYFFGHDARQRNRRFHGLRGYRGTFGCCEIPGAHQMCDTCMEGNGKRGRKTTHESIN